MDSQKWVRFAHGFYGLKRFEGNFWAHRFKKISTDFLSEACDFLSAFLVQKNLTADFVDLHGFFLVLSLPFYSEVVAECPSFLLL